MMDGAIHAASVNPKSDEFELNSLRTLFHVAFTSPLGTVYDVAADGEHFVFATFPENISVPLVLVTNWSADLRK